MIGSTEAVPIRPVEQPTLFGAEAEGLSEESEAGKRSRTASQCANHLPSGITALWCAATRGLRFLRE